VSAPPDHTQPATAPAPRRAASGGAALFLVARGDQPLARPIRVLLGRVDEVAIRRADRVDVSSSRGGALAVIALPDARISSTHARLAYVGHRWHVEDGGSRNGTFVNGVRTARATLADGDVVDAGHAVFRYRDAVDQSGEAITPLAPAEPGMSSVLPDLHRSLVELGAMATSTLPLLLEGETGTGKEVVARAAHARSQRSGELVAVNCGALPRERVGAELFGWRRGAFPGATSDHLGLVRAADGGTLFLDEVGDLAAAEQATLLRVLQEKEVLPIAATRPVPVDLRVVAATHRPLDAMVAAGEFRADLLARLAGYRTTLWPLREHREDLGLVVGDLLRARHAAIAESVTIHVAALRALVAYAWPANIRELEHALAHALVRRAADRALSLADLPAAVVAGAASPSRPRVAADEARREQLIALLRTHTGNIAAVARDLGKARMQVQRWLSRYGIDAEDYR
jgi:DNA-binding NtrC family response regulator